VKYKDDFDNVTTFFATKIGEKSYWGSEPFYIAISRITFENQSELKKLLDPHNDLKDNYDYTILDIDNNFFNKNVFNSYNFLIEKFKGLEKVGSGVAHPFVIGQEVPNITNYCFYK